MAGNADHDWVLWRRTRGGLAYPSVSVASVTNRGQTCDIVEQKEFLMNNEQKFFIMATSLRAPEPFNFSSSDLASE